MGQKLKVGDRVRLSAHGLRLTPESKSIKEWCLDSDWEGALKSPRDIYEVQEIHPRVPFVKLGKRTKRRVFRRVFKSGPLTGYWVKRDWVKKA